MSVYTLLNTKVEMVTDKEWSAERIKGLLNRNNNAVLVGLVRIYSLQTADEKMFEHTNEHNGVGFSAYDAPFLSKMAVKVMNKQPLTKMQIANIRCKLLKYSGQLAKIANKEIIIPA